MKTTTPAKKKKPTATQDRALALPSKMAAFLTRSRDQLERYQSLSIQTQPDCDDAMEVLAWVKLKLGAAKELTAPLLSKTKAAYDEAKFVAQTIRAPFEKLDVQIRDAVAVFLTAQQQKAQEEQRRLLAAAPPALAVVAGPDEEVEFASTPGTMIAGPVLATGGMRTYWHAEVESLPEVVRAIADGKASIALVQPDPVGLNAYAKQFDGSEQWPDAERERLRVPGVRVWSETRPVVR